MGGTSGVLVRWSLSEPELGIASDPFPVRVCLRQLYPLSPFLFIIFEKRISRRNQVAEGVRFSNLRIPSLLFADDVVLLASSNSDLLLSLGRFAAKCKAARMRISTSNSEAMVLSWKRLDCHSRQGKICCSKWRSLSFSGSC